MKFKHANYAPSKNILNFCFLTHRFVKEGIVVIRRSALYLVQDCSNQNSISDSSYDLSLTGAHFFT